MGSVLEQVASYSYLGTIVEKAGKIDKEIHEKIGKAGRINKSLKSKFVEKKDIPKVIKTQV